MRWRASEKNKVGCDDGGDGSDDCEHAQEAGRDAWRQVWGDARSERHHADAKLDSAVLQVAAAENGSSEKSRGSKAGENKSCRHFVSSALVRTEDIRKGEGVMQLA